MDSIVRYSRALRGVKTKDSGPCDCCVTRRAWRSGLCRLCYETHGVIPTPEKQS